MSLTTSHVVPAPRELVWDWHTRTGALTRLTPPFAPITPVTQADKLSDGTTILALPAGLKWVARHDLSNYRRGHRFTDVCTSAPIKLLANWRHVHEFADHPDGTLVTDSVTTRVPGAALKSMFAYRQQQLINDISFLDRIAHLQPEQPLTVAVTGSRGLVGRALSAQLTTAGHEVIQLVRKNPKPGQREWDPFSPDPDLLDGVDVLVTSPERTLVDLFRYSSLNPSMREASVRITDEMFLDSLERCHSGEIRLFSFESVSAIARELGCYRAMRPFTKTMRFRRADLPLY